MSGASGKVPAAIHITPEAIDNGIIGKIRNGDEIEIDAISGKINVKEEISSRELIVPTTSCQDNGFGRNLFALLRKNAVGAESGAGLDLMNNN